MLKLNLFTRKNKTKINPKINASSKKIDQEPVPADPKLPPDAEIIKPYRPKSVNEEKTE